MSVEEREKTEKNDIREQCIQALESYLRQEASPSAMNNSMVASGMEKRLAMKVRDWALKYSIEFTQDECVDTAREAITRYLNNWKGKVQGEDNRAHKLGKSKYL